ncbi:hypothetical protein GDO81_016143 [Engystomops pustulosus]|uniref:Uncharacterized protein n=1 Tax=Engystomops pustulosus TaxID=76066 RepID=A0AAV7AS71_ENGPU|nr:hypothetical protein GDO81_016143 [Engystomops pustulosus]
MLYYTPMQAPLRGILMPTITMWYIGFFKVLHLASLGESRLTEEDHFGMFHKEIKTCLLANKRLETWSLHLNALKDPGNCIHLCHMLYILCYKHPSCHTK